MKCITGMTVLFAASVSRTNEKLKKDAFHECGCLNGLNTQINNDNATITHKQITHYTIYTLSGLSVTEC